MSEIALNQNMADGWRSDLGAVRAGRDTQWPTARLAPERRGRFSLAFRPPGLILGLAILGVALAATAWAWRR